MSTITTPPRRPYPLHRWKADEFERLVAHGFLREGGPEFLWDGEIVTKRDGTIRPARRWTIAEFERLIDLGLVRDHRHAFLWDGEILRYMTINPPHVTVCTNLEECLRDRLDRVDWAIRRESPLIIGEGYQPEPDIVVADGPRQKYGHRHPEAADVALVVEIADTSYYEDAGAMLREYARAGISQYWIVHINARRVEVRRNPHLIDGVGAYDAPEIYPPDTSVPLVLVGAPGRPDREYPAISVREILRGFLPDEA